MAPLSATDVADQADALYQQHIAERYSLDQVRRYWKARQALPAVIPSSAPRQVRVLAKIARVNICDIVVNSLAQGTFVDGFRADTSDQDLEVWRAWQANKMDARQTGIHRAAFAYGCSYALVLPGDTGPTIRGSSPRTLFAAYGDDPDWPEYALERRSRGVWRLYDDQAVYVLRRADEKQANGTTKSVFQLVDVSSHGLGVCPVIRYLDEDDLDCDDEVEPGIHLIEEENVPARGQIAPLMALQDQIDLTTFGLLTTQWYQQFKQRYIIGWTAEDEEEQMKVGANQFLTFDENPDEMKIGELTQSDLSGFLNSREASLRHGATLAQVAVHELTGQLANLSADAIRAAENGKDLKVGERKTLLGESHEQMLGLVGDAMNVDVPDDAQVVWRDTSVQTFAAVVDALGKLTTMLGIPQEELWERIPGVTQQDVERFRAAKSAGDAFAQLTEALNRQATPPAPGSPPAPGPTPPASAPAPAPVPAG